MSLLRDGRTRCSMVNEKTVAGLRETLEDLEKQLDKAAEKHDALLRRIEAVRTALDIVDIPG